MPVLKPKEVVAALERAGFEIRRHTGSHVIMYKPDLRRPISVPQHPRDLPKGTIRAIIREAGLTVEEFMKLL
ncbi:MAG: type II toxin-antitoxin system HicA family toxin [Dehalococcoidia bacterium]